ncbi:hypothetical protein ACHAPT_012520 [Fusarium lateritium]
MLMDAYISLETFTELHRQAQHVRSLQDKYDTQISPEKDLPEKYMVALLRFRYFLEKTAKSPLERLKMVVASSPPMHKFWVREPPTDPNSPKIVIRLRHGVKKTKDEEHLMWLLQTLWEDEYNLS